jgi:hypothetical protein
VPADPKGDQERQDQQFQVEDAPATTGAELDVTAGNLRGLCAVTDVVLTSQGVARQPPQSNARDGPNRLPAIETEATKGPWYRRRCEH